MSWYQISVAKEENRYIFFWWLVSYSQIALCGTKFDTYCAKVNFTHLHSIKTSKTEVKGKTWQKLAKVDKSWQKLAKVGKSWQKLQKLQKTAKVGNSYQKLTKFGKNAKNCHKFLVRYSWAATIYATRYPTRYPDFFLLPYPNPTRSQKNPTRHSLVLGEPQDRSRLMNEKDNLTVNIVGESFKRSVV